MKNNSKFNRGFIVPLIVAIVAVLIAGGAYMIWRNNNVSTVTNDSANVSTTNTTNSGQSVETANNVSISTPTPNNNWETYISTSTDFSIQYPQGWMVTEYQSPALGFQVTFSSPSSTPTETNLFGVKVYGADTKSVATLLNEYTTLIDKYIKIAGGKLQNSNLKISGVTATQLDIDNSVPLQASSIFFGKGNYTYKIFETGPLYYRSSLFDQYYNSFKFTN
jgi:hypothetical protein